jgi:uncharacterized damage-inducible protein DinB
VTRIALRVIKSLAIQSPRRRSGSTLSALAFSSRKIASSRFVRDPGLIFNKKIDPGSRVEPGMTEKIISNKIMSFKDLFLIEFDREMATTRKMLERVPFDKFTWTPHAKSMPLGKLAVHVAILPRFAAAILTQEKEVFGPEFKSPTVDGIVQLVALFDEKAKIAREAIVATDEVALEQSWALFFGDRKIAESSRADMLRNLFMNHLIHHRAQLGVYLRLNDIAIPGSYGPSADERM